MRLIVKTSDLGRGVFAGEPIAAGELVIRFTGPMLRYAQTTPETYALQIGPDLYIGASGNEDDFINHSCSPNAGFRIEGTQADLYAIRKIEAGEEIFFDYSTTLDEDDFEMPCQCGQADCRKLIRDGKHLPEEVWERYLGRGIIPEYVQQSRKRLGDNQARG
jgi:SET domain-containing protein